MIEPASLADWITFVVMTAGLGLGLGHRWVLVAAPAKAATPRAAEATDRALGRRNPSSRARSPVEVDLLRRQRRVPVGSGPQPSRRSSSRARRCCRSSRTASRPHPPRAGPRGALHRERVDDRRRVGAHLRRARRMQGRFAVGDQFEDLLVRRDLRSGETSPPLNGPNAGWFRMSRATWIALHPLPMVLGCRQVVEPEGRFHAGPRSRSSPSPGNSSTSARCASKDAEPRNSNVSCLLRARWRAVECYELCGRVDCEGCCCMW